MVVMTTNEADMDTIAAQIESIEAAISDVKDDLAAMEAHEPSLDTKREAFEYFVTEHPNLRPTELDSDFERDGWYTYYDCTNKKPGNSNVGTGRTDAADYLSEQGYSVTPCMVEEWPDGEHDLLLEVSVEEA